MPSEHDDIKRPDSQVSDDDVDMGAQTDAFETTETGAKELDKKALLRKLMQVEGLSTDERSYLTELIKTRKKYGLVWEDKPEEVEQQLARQIPVLKEVKERAIIHEPSESGSSDEPEVPNHMLIEGDNLHALSALSFTHTGKVDLIYIDPPYNTGKKDEFKYNDRYIDEEDSFRHSKWLSFMSKRLEIAHTLLASDGVMIISIDDHEVAQLKLVCDEIFNSNPNPKASNHIGFLIWDLGTGTQAGHFVRSHEYLLVYAKNKSLLPNFRGGEGEIKHSSLKKISVKNPASEFTFPAGTKFTAEDGTELKGNWGGSEKTTLIKGRMLAKDGKTTEEVTLSAGWAMKNQMFQYFYNDPDNTYDSKGQKLIEFFFNKSGVLTYRKEKSITNPPSVLREVASTKQGTSLLKSIFNGNEPIQFAKPIQLIMWFMKLMPEKKVMLDFFAGSGTTMHSVIQQNLDDNGDRKCIIVTNNENKIAEEVAYVRNKRVIQGYTNAKGEKIEGLKKNNLRYYTCDFVDNEDTEEARRQLTRLSTALICIREDCYTDITETAGFSAKYCQIFKGAGAQYLIIIYYSREMLEVQHKLLTYIAELDTSKKIKLYGYSTAKEVLEAEFQEVEDKIEAVALPETIQEAYRAVCRSLQLA